MSENETENDTPVSDTLLVMTATSLDNSDLSPRELMIARIAALVAVDASAASYALNAVPATDSDITLDDVEDILVAVAPIVGTARVVSATVNIAEGLGFVIALAEAELGRRRRRRNWRPRRRTKGSPLAGGVTRRMIQPVAPPRPIRAAAAADAGQHRMTPRPQV